MRSSESDFDNGTESIRTRRRIQTTIHSQLRAIVMEIEKLDELSDRITGPLKEMIAISKQEILSELVRISSHYDAHHSHDSALEADWRSSQKTTRPSGPTEF